MDIMSATSKQSQAQDSGASKKPGFFQRIFQKLDEKMKAKAEEQADCCCCEDKAQSEKKSDRCC